MAAKKDPATVSLDSIKGQERAARMVVRANYLENRCHGWVAMAEASAIRWILARLENLEARIRAPKISQAQAAAIIEAWREQGQKLDDGRPVLDGMPLDDLGIR